MRRRVQGPLAEEDRERVDGPDLDREPVGQAQLVRLAREQFAPGRGDCPQVGVVVERHVHRVEVERRGSERGARLVRPIRAGRAGRVDRVRRTCLVGPVRRVGRAGRVDRVRRARLVGPVRRVGRREIVEAHRVRRAERTTLLCRRDRFEPLGQRIDLRRDLVPRLVGRDEADYERPALLVVEGDEPGRRHQVGVGRVRLRPIAGCRGCASGRSRSSRT